MPQYSVAGNYLQGTAATSMLTKHWPVLARLKPEGTRHVQVPPQASGKCCTTPPIGLMQAASDIGSRTANQIKIHGPVWPPLTLYLLWPSLHVPLVSLLLSLLVISLPSRASSALSPLSPLYCLLSPPLRGPFLGQLQSLSESANNPPPRYYLPLDPSIPDIITVRVRVRVLQVQRVLDIANLSPLKF